MKKAKKQRREPGIMSSQLDRASAFSAPAGADTLKAVYKAVGVLVLIGVLTHFVGLTYPREVVFDEVHMGKFVSSYCCTGKRFFDVHPPHGKLLIALGTKLGGYDGLFSFDRIGQPYGDNPVFFLRLVPALSGILIAPLFFLLLGFLGASLPTAFLGGLMMVFENALLVETRILVFDGILIAATLGALVCFFAAERALSARAKWFWNVASGALAGLAVGTKLTGLSAFALISVYLATRVLAHRDWSYFLRRLKQWAVISGAAAAIYVGGWAIHFALLPNPGPGDAFHPTTGHFVEDFFVSHDKMVTVNYNLDKTHPDASPPWTWPLMKVAPYYWAGDNKTIYLVGNPVVWWGASLLFLVFVVNLGLMKVTRLKVDAAMTERSLLWVPLAGYLISFLPLLGVKRVLFLYHYLTPLLFSVMFVLLWLERAGWIRPGGVTQQRRSYYVVAALVVVGFLVVSPVTFGLSLGGYNSWLAGFIRSWRWVDSTTFVQRSIFLSNTW